MTGEMTSVTGHSSPRLTMTLPPTRTTRAAGLCCQSQNIDTKTWHQNCYPSNLTLSQWTTQKNHLLCTEFLKCVLLICYWVMWPAGHLPLLWKIHNACKRMIVDSFSLVQLAVSERHNFIQSILRLIAFPVESVHISFSSRLMLTIKGWRAQYAQASTSMRLRDSLLTSERHLGKKIT